jgi:hypothetical protein
VQVTQSSRRKIHLEHAVSDDEAPPFYSPHQPPTPAAEPMPPRVQWPIVGWVRAHPLWLTLCAIGIGIAVAIDSYNPDLARDPRSNDFVRLGIWLVIVFGGLNRLVATAPAEAAQEITVNDVPRQPSLVGPIARVIFFAGVWMMFAFTALYALVRFIKWAWTD